MIPTTESTMTVKEVADVFKCEERTIQKYVKKLFPEIVIAGKTTNLNQFHVTKIRAFIDKNHHLAVNKDSEQSFAVDIFSNLPSSKLDKRLIVAQAMQILNEEIQELKAENNQLFNTVLKLTHSGKTYTTTEIAKEMGLRSAAQLNNILELNGIQYKVNDTWVLSAKYSGNNYDSIKQEELESGKIIYNRHWTDKGRQFIIDYIAENGTM